jgi:hypothetical protein
MDDELKSQISGILARMSSDIARDKAFYQSYDAFVATLGRYEQRIAEVLKILERG